MSLLSARLPFFFLAHMVNGKGTCRVACCDLQMGFLPAELPHYLRQVNNQKKKKMKRCKAHAFINSCRFSSLSLRLCARHQHRTHRTHHSLSLSLSSHLHYGHLLRLLLQLRYPALGIRCGALHKTSLLFLGFSLLILRAINASLRASCCDSFFFSLSPKFVVFVFRVWVCICVTVSVLRRHTRRRAVNRQKIEKSTSRESEKVNLPTKLFFSSVCVCV